MEMLNESFNPDSGKPFSDLEDEKPSRDNYFYMI